MTIREHAILFWGLVARWPRITAIVIGGLAVFYFVYYAAVEGLPVLDSLLAGLGMALMCICLKTAYLFVFYRYFHLDAFKGSFLVLAFMAALPLAAAIAISIMLALQHGEGPPPDVIPLLLLGCAVGFSLLLGATARFIYWAGDRGLRRR